MSDINFDRLARELNYRNVDQLYEYIGIGDLPLGRVVKHLTISDKEREEDEFAKIIREPTDHGKSPDDTVSVRGLKGLLTTTARCCNPAPGDAIVGYITRGRGATIHRQDCPNVLRIKDRERLVRVSWGEAKHTYPVPVRVKAYDRDGLMKDVATLISDEGINMTGVNVDVSKNRAIFDMTLEVRDIAELSRILDRLENLPNVMEANRVKPG
jgi:GTP pyrophosphokinase